MKIDGVPDDECRFGKTPHPWRGEKDWYVKKHHASETMGEKHNPVCCPEHFDKVPDEEDWVTISDVEWG